MSVADLYCDIQPQRITREIHGDSLVTTYSFSTGETLRETTKYRDEYHRETIVEIDGDLVFHGSWIYRDMEWRLAV